MACNLEQAMLISRALGPVGVGQLGLFRQTLLLTIQVACLDLPTAAIYTINQKKMEASKVIAMDLWTCLGTSLAAGVVLLVLFAAVRGFFGKVTA